jgi:hypothetical protein
MLYATQNLVNIKSQFMSIITIKCYCSLNLVNIKSQFMSIITIKCYCSLKAAPSGPDY